MNSPPPPGEPSTLVEQPQNRSSFEQLLISLSTRFINIPIEAIGAGIDEALGEVGRYTGVERCFIYQLSGKTYETAQLTHEWVAPGMQSIRFEVQNLPAEPVMWIANQLMVGDTVHVPDRDKLPPDAQSLRLLHESVGIRSAVYVPMILRGELTGMLGFTCSTVSKEWPEDNINLLRIVGEIVINAMDRKTQFNKLQDSRERYRTVVQDVSCNILRWRADGTQLFVNRSYCDFRNMEEQALLKENVYDLLSPSETLQVKEMIAALTPENPFNTNEITLVMPDGSVVCHELSNRGLFDENNELFEIQSIGRDITAQKQAREELLYRQQLEQLILNLSLRFINLPPERLEHEIIDALRAISEFVGGERTYIYLMNEETGMADLSFEWVKEGATPTVNELRQLPVTDHAWAIELFEKSQPVIVNDVDDLDEEADNLRALLEAIQTRSLITVPVLRNKKLFATFSITSNTKNNKWTKDTIHLLRLIGEVFVNAMARKAAEQALADSEERLRSTIDAVADGFYDWDIPAKQVYVSDNWLENRGLISGGNLWTLDDWQAFIHPEDRAQAMERLNDHLQGRSEIFECEYRVLMPGETYRWMLDRGRVIERSPQGEPLRMVGVDRDIDRLVEDRHRLEEADARLAHLSRVAMMGEIVAGIAHEVNQPLHAAATFASAIGTAISRQDDDCMDRVADMVQKISKQINRAADIIRRLREFTRPRPVRMAKFDLNELIRESVDMPGLGSQRKNVRMILDLYLGLSPVIGDRVQVQQVIVNLLRNALDASQNVEMKDGRGPQLLIRTEPSDERVLLQVVDNGCGLSEGTDIEKMFHAFHTTKEEGMGIGLALCRSIVTSHHGKIWGEPNPEHGMTLSVLLPADPERKSE